MLVPWSRVCSSSQAWVGFSSYFPARANFSRSGISLEANVPDSTDDDLEVNNSSDELFRVQHKAYAPWLNSAGDDPTIIRSSDKKTFRVPTNERDGKN